MYRTVGLITDISIAAVDLLQEMTDVETDEDNEDSINALFDALVSIILQLANVRSKHLY